MKRLVVVVIGVAIVGGIAGTAQTDVFISDVTTTPSEPTTGESVTFAATVVNPTTNEFTVETVRLRTADGRTLEERDVRTTIDSDGEGTVSISRAFDDPGSQTLELVVEGSIFGVQVTKRVTVEVNVAAVREPDAAIVSEDATVGEETTVSVAVSNGGGEQLRSVSVRLRGESFTANRTQYVRPTLAAERSETFDFGVTFDEAGRQTVTTVIEYVTVGGTERRLVRNLTTDVAPARREAVVSARLGDGARPPVEATVTNLGNVPLKDPRLVVVSNGTTVGQTTLSAIDPGAERTVSVNVSDPGSSLTVQVAYAAAGQTGTAETSVRYLSNPATIELTGVEAENADGHVRLSGSASNVGIAPAQSVLVEVVDEPGVESVGPNPEFFVGRVGASEFVSFELDARLTDDRTTVPIRVTWIDDGRERTGVVEVEVAAPRTPAVEPSSTTPDRPVLLGAGVVGLGVVLLMGYGLYNSLS